MASLYAQNAIARIKVEQAQAALAAAEANLEAAKAHQTRLLHPKLSNSKSKQHSRHNSIINSCCKNSRPTKPRAPVPA